MSSRDRIHGTKYGDSLPTDRTYTGQEDDGSYLLYYGARYYDPRTGQFMSPDTIVPDASNLFDYNRYMYGYGNPVKYSDPSGHIPEITDGGAAGDYSQWTRWGELYGVDDSRLGGEMLAWMQDHQNYELITGMMGFLEKYYADAQGVPQMFETGFANAMGGGDLPELWGGEFSGQAAALAGIIFAAKIPDGFDGDPRDGYSSLTVGRRSQQVNVLPGTNRATSISGRLYSGHALDRMQQGGLVPEVIENTIRIGTTQPGNIPGRIVYYDNINNLRVVLDESSGRVVTTGFGRP